MTKTTRGVNYVMSQFPLKTFISTTTGFDVSLQHEVFWVAHVHTTKNKAAYLSKILASFNTFPKLMYAISQTEMCINSRANTKSITFYLPSRKFGSNVTAFSKWWMASQISPCALNTHPAIEMQLRSLKCWESMKTQLPRLDHATAKSPRVSMAFK